MEFCFLAKLVIIFSLFGIIIGNILFGFSIIDTIFNPLIGQVTYWVTFPIKSELFP